MLIWNSGSSRCNPHSKSLRRHLSELKDVPHLKGLFTDDIGTHFVRKEVKSGSTDRPPAPLVSELAEHWVTSKMLFDELFDETFSALFAPLVDALVPKLPSKTQCSDQSQLQGPPLINLSHDNRG
jgi:hypothetical protein